MIESRGLVVRNRYQDSVRLMRITEAVLQMPGVSAAGVIAATPANLGLLRAGGLWFEGASTATSNDIVIVVAAADAAIAEHALGTARRSLDQAAQSAQRVSYVSTAAALADAPSSALGFVAVPGDFAAAEASKVLESGRSVVIFSDNVQTVDELHLKQEAHRRGLLVMGPDAGTTSIDGVGIGFCNAIAPGRFGILAASGTGAQAVASLLSEVGEGISAILGVGSNDPTDEIGGISLFDGLNRLEGDAGTEVIILVAKTLGLRTRRRLLSRLRTVSKPVITLIPGWSDGWITGLVGGIPAFTFVDAVDKARHATSRREVPPIPQLTMRGPIIRGLFAGGTLAQEARAVLESLTDGSIQIQVLDLGGDEYTRGRPHPMIAPSLVAEAIMRASREPDVGALIFDVVLGYGAHPDPAGLIAAAVRAAATDSAGAGVQFAAVLCGTADDPQDFAASRAALLAAGCLVAPDPATAVLGLLGLPDDNEGDWVGSVGPLASPDALVVIGADWFAEALEAQGVPVLHVDWRPVAGGDDELNSLLARLS